MAYFRGGLHSFKVCQMTNPTQLNSSPPSLKDPFLNELEGQGLVTAVQKSPCGAYFRREITVEGALIKLRFKIGELTNPRLSIWEILSSSSGCIPQVSGVGTRYRSLDFLLFVKRNISAP